MFHFWRIELNKSCLIQLTVLFKAAFEAPLDAQMDAFNIRNQNFSIADFTPNHFKVRFYTFYSINRIVARFKRANQEMMK